LTRTALEVSKVASPSETMEGSEERSWFSLPQSPLFTRCRDRDGNRTLGVFELSCQKQCVNEIDRYRC
jgi:hypothetical protein